MSDAKADAAAALAAHGQALDALHQRLAAMPGADKERLAHAVAKFKAAHQVFVDDALICIGN
jgi:hypothetical protein